MQPAIQKNKQYSAEGTISQLKNCGENNISFYILDKQQIQIYDTVKSIIIRKITLPQRMFHYEDRTQIIFDERDIIEYFITNDLRKLILVWKNYRVTEIYDLSSNRLIERLQGQILGYFNNKIILDYFYHLEDHAVHLFTVDILSKYRQQYKYETSQQARVYCFQKNLLITDGQQTKLRFINLNQKDIQIQFRQSLSYPQINYTHNRNYFLLGFQDPHCIKLMVKQTQRFKQIKKFQITLKFFIMIEAGKQIFYCDQASMNVFRMDLFYLKPRQATNKGHVSQILCTQNKKCFLLSRFNKIMSQELTGK